MNGARDRGVLLSLAAKRLLNVGEVCAGDPCELEIDRDGRSVGQPDRRAKPGDPDVVTQNDVDRAMRDALSIRRLRLVRVAAAAAAKVLQLGIGVLKLERLRLRIARLAEPR